MLVQEKLRTGLCAINDHDTNYRLINKDTPPKNLLLELRVRGRRQKVGVGLRIVGTWFTVAMSLIPELVR